MIKILNLIHKILKKLKIKLNIVYINLKMKKKNCLIMILQLIKNIKHLEKKKFD